MSIQNEIWRDVVGYEGYYEMSNWGRVKSLNYRRTGQERILRPGKITDGYLSVVLCKDEKKKTFLVHRLVGIVFPDMVGWIEKVKGKPFEELEVNHKDQNKQNNHVSNLEWCDRRYNNNYGTHNETVAKANTNGKMSKTVAQKTKDGKLVKIWPSLNEIQRQTGWSCGNIAKCCSGKYKSAYGFLWSYTKPSSCC